MSATRLPFCLLYSFIFALSFFLRFAINVGLNVAERTDTQKKKWLNFEWLRVKNKVKKSTRKSTSARVSEIKITTTRIETALMLEFRYFFFSVVFSLRCCRCGFNVHLIKRRSHINENTFQHYNFCFILHFIFIICSFDLSFFSVHSFDIIFLVFLLKNFRFLQSNPNELPLSWQVRKLFQVE